MLTEENTQFEMRESMSICSTMSHFKSNNHYNLLSEYSELHLKNKPPDCCLYSEDGHEFKMHKELLGSMMAVIEFHSVAGDVPNELTRRIF